MRLRDVNKEITIREKAIELVVNEGFQGLSMQKLAKEANVSAATIYIYFKNKEDLLNQSYLRVEEVFEQEVLRGFSPDLPFEEGLWLQWRNRLRFISKHPFHYHFMEQFTSSSLVKHDDIKESRFKGVMGAFLKNALARNEVKNFSFEIYWALAYGPFYALVRLHLQNTTLFGSSFKLTEKTLRQTFDAAIMALQP